MDKKIIELLEEQRKLDEEIAGKRKSCEYLAEFYGFLFGLLYYVFYSPNDSYYLTYRGKIVLPTTSFIFLIIIVLIELSIGKRKERLETIKEELRRLGDRTT